MADCCIVSGLVHQAFETVESCACREGCARCESNGILHSLIVNMFKLPQGVQSSTCKESNIVSSKLGARVVLRGLLNLPMEEDAIPRDENGITDTVVNADPVGVAPGVVLETVDA